MQSIFIILCILLLNSCSTLSKEDCTNKNWFQLGVADAMDGEVEPKTTDYRRDCSEHGLQIKSMDYLKGFESGLTKFCTYHSGLRRGENGKNVHSLCEEVNPKYKAGYKVGFREFKRKESIINVKEELIEDNGGKECSFASECISSSICISGRCEKSDKKCSYDSECDIEGRCDSVSQWTDYNDNVSVNVCKEPF
jgi:hypothetical protein